MKKIVFCGASQRALGACAKNLLADFSGSYEIAGVFDIDRGRMRGFCELLGKSLPQTSGKRLATLEDGAQAVLTGAAANLSVKTGKKIDAHGLLL